MVGGRNERIVPLRKESATSVPSPHTPPKNKSSATDLGRDRMYPLPNTNAKTYPKSAGGIGINVTSVMTMKKMIANVTNALRLIARCMRFTSPSITKNHPFKEQINSPLSKFKNVTGRRQEIVFSIIQ